MAQITNNDLLKEVKAIHALLQDHEARLKPLEQWKIAYDAADAAISRYKQDHKEAASFMANKPSVFSDGVNKDFVKVVLQFLAVIASLLGIFYLVLQQFTK